MPHRKCPTPTSGTNTPNDCIYPQIPQNIFLSLLPSYTIDHILSISKEIILLGPASRWTAKNMTKNTGTEEKYSWRKYIEINLLIFTFGV